MSTAEATERPAARRRARVAVQHTPPPTGVVALATVATNAGRHDVTINLRAPAQARDLIDCAAAVEGKTRTEFMLDSACRRAQEVLLDKKLFLLEGEKYEAVLRLLDAPPPPNIALKRLLQSKSPWDR